MGPNDLLESEEAMKVLEAHGLHTARRDPELANLNFKGLPFRGRPYVVDQNNPPIFSKEVHIRQFDLSEEEDLKEYERIFQNRADGLNEISFEEKVYDESIKSWRVLLRWYDIFYSEPKKKKDVTNGEGQ